MLPYLIGVTGRIATGKSKLSAYAAHALNCPMFDLDKTVHQLYTDCAPLRNAMVLEFGKEVISNINGKESINRKALREIAFRSSADLSRLNKTVLPCLQDYMREQLHKMVSHKHIVIEGAVIFENNWENKFDTIWCTYCTDEVILGRLTKERKVPMAIAHQILKQQYKGYEKHPKCTVSYTSANTFESNKVILDEGIKQLKLSHPVPNALQYW